MHTITRNGKASLEEEVTVCIDGKDLCCSVRGGGPAIVLLHSLLADQSSFDYVAIPLSKERTVVRMNLPGFGQSAPIRGGIEATADHVSAAIKDLDLGPDIVILGNGYGAFIATSIAIRSPGLATKLVLAGCGGAFADAGRHAFRGMSKAAECDGLDSVSATAMGRLFPSDFRARFPELVAERKRCFLMIDPDIFHDACEGLAVVDFRPYLSGIHMPVIVMVGDRDEATPPDMAREMVNMLPNAFLQNMDGCAHLPQLQDPINFVSKVSGFISRE